MKTINIDQDFNNNMIKTKNKITSKLFPNESLNLLGILFFLLFSITSKAQNKEFSFDEYLGYVKKFHPLVKSANLEISGAQANLIMARGGFDPKIEVDFDKKQFKNSEYYSVLNSSFKIPTWYGIDFNFWIKSATSHN